MHLQETIRHNALTRLYEEAGLSAAIRRSLNFILLGNICGSAHGSRTFTNVCHHDAFNDRAS